MLFLVTWENKATFTTVEWRKREREERGREGGRERGRESCIKIQQLHFHWNSNVKLSFPFFIHSLSFSFFLPFITQTHTHTLAHTWTHTHTRTLILLLFQPLQIWSLSVKGVWVCAQLYSWTPDFFEFCLLGCSSLWTCLENLETVKPSATKGRQHLLDKFSQVLETKRKSISIAKPVVLEAVGYERLLGLTWLVGYISFGTLLKFHLCLTMSSYSILGAISWETSLGRFFFNFYLYWTPVTNLRFLITHKLVDMLPNFL